MSHGKIEIAYNGEYGLEKLKEFVTETGCVRLSGRRSWPEENGDEKATCSPEESIRRVRENAEFEELADVFKYCYNHLEEWENGEINPSDIPHVDEFTAAVILRSIAFGCSWEEYVPANRSENLSEKGSDSE